MKFHILTAAAMFAGTAAFADDHMANTLRSGDLTDVSIYTANVGEGFTWDDSQEFTEVNPEWDEVGTVTDIVLDNDGKMIGIIADVGGMLNLSDTEVMLDMKEFSKFKEGGEDDAEWVFVTGLSQNQLEERNKAETEAEEQAEEAEEAAEKDAAATEEPAEGEATQQQ